MTVESSTSHAVVCLPFLEVFINDLSNRMLHSNIYRNLPMDKDPHCMKGLIFHGFIFFELTNFPDFSIFFSNFPIFLKFIFYLKYGKISLWFLLFRINKYSFVSNLYQNILFLSSILDTFP